VDAGTPVIRPVFETAAIEQAATPRLVLDTVRNALIAHAQRARAAGPARLRRGRRGRRHGHHHHPASAPVLEAAHVRDGAHVTGIGTDMPHKNELPPAIFGRAALIATDDRDQCLHHGDFGHAVRAGTVTATGDTPVGLLLEKPAERPDDAITVADLTGVGAVDAARASAVLRELTQ
jgi:Ornithine cyclodeaminase/mu-crystallin family